MARLFDDAQNDGLELNQTVLTAAPLVMACWFNSNDLTINQSPMNIVDINSMTRYFSIVLLNNADFNRRIRAATGNVTVVYADTSTAWSVDTWHHVCAIFAANDDRRILLDGGGKGTNAESKIPTDLDRTCIGWMHRSTPLQYMSGMIAEAAIWNLTNWPGATGAAKGDNFEKILPSLTKGFSPSFYPLGLKAYWPLVRGLNDPVGGYNLTASGTTVSSHPRIILPQGVQ